MVRLDASEVAIRIGLDDFCRVLTEMPPAARSMVEGTEHRVAELFLVQDQYAPQSVPQAWPQRQIKSYTLVGPPTHLAVAFKSATTDCV